VNCGKSDHTEPRSTEFQESLKDPDASCLSSIVAFQQEESN
jgi:hypothetical protein